MRQFMFLGIRFLDGTFAEIKQTLDCGGVMVVPAAPALATIPQDPHYHRALQDSCFAIFDSGFLCLLLRLKGIRVVKLSGLAFLRLFLRDVAQLAPDSLFLIDPTADDAAANCALLAQHGYALGATQQYIAPFYDDPDITDDVLVSQLQLLRPRYILINLGGGVQEKLGVYISQQLDYAPSVICTGAAIAFLTGRQAAISPLMDRLYLGWLVRCMADYKRFIPRYLAGLKLIPLLLKEKFEECSP